MLQLSTTNRSIRGYSTSCVLDSSFNVQVAMSLNDVNFTSYRFSTRISHPHLFFWTACSMAAHNTHSSTQHLQATDPSVHPSTQRVDAITGGSIISTTVTVPLVTAPKTCTQPTSQKHSTQRSPTHRPRRAFGASLAAACCGGEGLGRHDPRGFDTP